MTRAFATTILLAACSSDPGGMRLDGPPPPDAGPPSAVDLLFVIEDGDTTVQENIAMNLPVLIDALQHAPSGAPDLHMAFMTPEMGAGTFTTTVPGCSNPDWGAFIDIPRVATDPACQSNRLNAGEHFFKDGVSRNYSGDLATAAGCIAQVGWSQCPFHHQFAALRMALGDPDHGIYAPDGNAGFLRPNARLAIIFTAQDDDCSAPDDTLLFDPSQNSLSDPLGPLGRFRCAEFGITCDGLTATNGRLPRVATGPLQNCRSNDAYATVDPQHSLIPLPVFIDYLHRISPDFVLAVIGAPIEPFAVVVDPQNGFPAMEHSCSSSNGIFANPAVRAHQVVESLGAHALFTSICQDSYTDAFGHIGNLILTP
jgi:hypothetical protein